MKLSKQPRCCTYAMRATLSGAIVAGIFPELSSSAIVSSRLNFFWPSCQLFVKRLSCEYCIARGGMRPCATPAPPPPPMQAVYVPADDLTDPAPATTFAHLDATTVLSRSIAELGIYPAVDPLDSTSRILDPAVVGARHYSVARGVQKILQDYKNLQVRDRMFAWIVCVFGWLWLCLIVVCRFVRVLLALFVSCVWSVCVFGWLWVCLIVVCRFVCVLLAFFVSCVWSRLKRVCGLGVWEVGQAVSLVDARLY